METGGRSNGPSGFAPVGRMRFGSHLSRGSYWGHVRNYERFGGGGAGLGAGPRGRTLHCLVC